MISMIGLVRDMTIQILCNLTRITDVRALYLSCKSMVWLRDLKYTLIVTDVDKVYVYEYVTVNLVGVMHGVHCILERDWDGDTCLTQMAYYEHGALVGNHLLCVYTDKGYQPIINGHQLVIRDTSVYETDEPGTSVANECISGILEQWPSVDSELFEYVRGTLFKHVTSMLVRAASPENTFVVKTPVGCEYWAVT